MVTSGYKRRSLLTFVAIALLMPFLLWGTQRSIQSMFNAPLHWIPPSFEARRQFDEFVEQFQSQEMIIISWPGCTVDDERLDRFAKALVSPDEEDTEARRQKLFTHVLTGYRLLRDLTAEPLELSRATAIRRLTGSLVGPDGSTSCAVVMLTRFGAIQRKEARAAILDTAEAEVGLKQDRFRLAGPAINGIAIDTESIRSIQKYGFPSAMISFVLCWLCLRSARLTVPVIVVAALGQTLMMAGVFFAGGTMNAVLIVLPPLVFVLTVSAGIHFVNYFYEALAEGDTVLATRRAVANAWRPCFLAAATTAIGLGSLLVSDIRPVKQFGALAAAGVMATFMLLFLLLPGVMETWPRSPRPRSGERSAGPNSPVRAKTAWDPWFVLSAVVWRLRTPITVGCLLLMIFSGAGLFWVRTSVDAVSLLRSDNRSMQDRRWFEENLGPLVPVEVIVHFDRNHPSDLLQRLDLVHRIQERVNRIDMVGGAMSAATFAPPVPRGRGAGAVVRRRVLNRHLESRRDRLAETHYLHETNERQSWRISARVEERGDVDYGLFLERLDECVKPILAEYANTADERISVTYTGVTPLVYAVQRELLVDLFMSFTMALLLVTTVMIVVLRSVLAGLVAMIPNVFPAIAIFGSMGWLGIAVDIGSVMTASVALGIAVDGTIHFLSWFRREVRKGRSRPSAISYVYRHCGRALTQTTIVCALGLMVYCVSGFVPARRFSWMLLLSLLAAMVGDLILLPALLVGPLGKLFVGRRDPAVSKAQGPRAAIRPHFQWNWRRWAVFPIQTLVRRIMGRTPTFPSSSERPTNGKPLAPSPPLMPSLGSVGESDCLPARVTHRTEAPP